VHLHPACLHTSWPTCWATFLTGTLRACPRPSSRRASAAGSSEYERRRELQVMHVYGYFLRLFIQCIFGIVGLFCHFVSLWSLDWAAALKRSDSGSWKIGRLAAFALVLTPLVLRCTSPSIGDRARSIGDRARGIGDRARGIGDRARGIGDRIFERP